MSEDQRCATGGYRIVTEDGDEIGYLPDATEGEARRAAQTLAADMGQPLKFGESAYAEIGTVTPGGGFQRTY